ncbi:carbohydrate ABC transporter substrate-binding protein [Paenibacillus hemerocallicola]|uniref:Carbohydrate ABC transporter substrate-binding protein n=1 Tax=Paenibacillus hemerocallicola TaxID=1172614 RepID=A0A5C4T4F8_9BACL|nr:ABC transporter substrate-binding protein [Paenibacillus hemerocallicola]TNJ63756.1 carbohydrate ABC transporter substrate-binding protein [Paenibacillus hemerocallicola]
MFATKMNTMIAVMAACLLATGCTGGSGRGETAESERGPTEQKADPRKIEETPTELTFTQPGLSEELFNQRYGDQLRKKFPNFKITYISTTAANFADTIASIPTLDVMFASASGMPQYLTGYRLENDISDLIKKYKYDVSKLQPVPIDVQRTLSGGSIYGFPTHIGTLVFLYNKDLFDKFGIAYPKDGMTWDEIYELARRMTRSDGGIQYKGLSMAWEHVVGWNQLSALYFDPQTEKAQYTNDGVKRVFENAARFWTIPGNEPPNRKYGLGAIRDWFLKDQTTAMYLDADGLIRMTADALKNWDLARYPVFSDNRDTGPAPNPTFGFITGKSKQRDAAFLALAYLTSEQYQEWAAKTLGSLPSLRNAEPLIKNFGESIPNFAGKNVQALLFPKSAQMQQTSPYYNSVGVREITTAINDYLAGKDANTVLREASERADKKVAEEKAK